VSIGHYYPYGQEKPSATTNGTEKFTGYFRDAETGLDYAVNRYHSPGTGRFLTVDPSGRSVRPSNPGSWNRYAYVTGDPINHTDRKGTKVDCTAWDCDDPDDDYDYDPNCDEDGAICYQQNSGNSGAAASSLPTSPVSVVSPVPISTCAATQDTFCTEVGYKPPSTPSNTSPDDVFSQLSTLTPQPAAPGSSPIGSQGENGFTGLEPLMSLQDTIDLYSVTHFIAPFAMIGSGLAVAAVGGIATFAACAGGGVGCLLSPITAGVLVAGLALAAAGTDYLTTGTMYTPIKH
jgi:RHS repeat-associated protein